MYTKMSASGSALISNPRTISKSLESKISAAIAGVIARHDMSQLSTKIVRQAVEREVKVSLSNHKEVLKRLMHQEFRKYKAQKLAAKSVPEPWRYKLRQETIRKAMKWTYGVVKQTGVFADVGVHAIQNFYQLENAATGVNRQIATMYARQLGAMWMQQPSLPEWQPKTLPTTSQVADALLSVYTVEQLGICHDRRAELLQFFGRSTPAYSVMDYFGWDPTAESTSDDSTPVTSSKLMANALLLGYLAHKLNVSLGCSFTQILQHLPSFYPYKGRDELSSEEFYDQTHLITTVVLVLSDFGRLYCEPELLPHEYMFLRQNLILHIIQQDTTLIGESLRALKCFSNAMNLTIVRRGMAFLLKTQREDGSWHSGVEETDAQQYYTTMNGIWGVEGPCGRGFAPFAPELLPILELQANAVFEANISASEKVETTTTTPVKSEETTYPAPPAEESLENQIKFLQGLLEKKDGNVKNASAGMATHVLSTLSSMKFSVEVLKSTGIGKVIYKLRKHSDAQVAKTASQLVTTWKKDFL